MTDVALDVARVTDAAQTNDASQDYDAFAEQILATGVLHDPWVDGAPRFRAEPLVLSASTYRCLSDAAGRIGALFEELCRHVAARPAVLDTYFRMTPAQRAMWELSSPLWHGLARADVFLTAQGPQICELNCDTPTGYAEAIVLNELTRDRVPGTTDPNRGFGERYLAMADQVRRRLAQAASTDVVGIVYPTEMPEDLSVIRLLRQWFEAAGHDVVLGSPFNLSRAEDGSAALFGEPISLLVRHYKTDWWGEREPVWDDEAPYPDALPLLHELRIVAEASLGGRTAVVNPFGSVVPQNKRAMAYLWEHRASFSTEGRRAIEELLPETVRLETLSPEQLVRERAGWVLKSDYGCEGEEVVVGPLVNDTVWRASVAHAREGRWIAQRYFEAAVDARGETANHGVYLVAGEVAGIYTRVQRGATDGRAQSVPTLVHSEIQA